MDLQSPAIPYSFKKKRANKMNAFAWKTKSFVTVTGEEFFHQDVPVEKSLASVLVTNHTASRTAHTILCQRLSPGEIPLQN